MDGGKKKESGLNGSFVTGAIALVFLILGYQVALFVHKAALTRIEANRDHPDTVYVIDKELAEGIFQRPEAAAGYTDKKADAPPDDKNVGSPQDEGPVILSEAKNIRSETVRKNAPHSPQVERLREQTRRVESFPFNPNTVSAEDLKRLGFSEKQAKSLDKYRQSGGRFNRPTDFAKSFVVADSVYKRLEPYIEIPKLDLNRADSTALLALPGIGPFFAGKIVAYREQLSGYSHPEQLMEIWHFDQEKYNGLQDLITCSEPEPYSLWTLPETHLARHPYISKAEAHGIVLYREHNPPEACTLEGLKKASVLSEEHASRLSSCNIAPAQ